MYCRNGADLSYRQSFLYQWTGLSNSSRLFKALCPDDLITRDAFAGFDKRPIGKDLVLAYIPAFDQQRLAHDVITAFNQRVDPLYHHGYVSKSLFIRHLTQFIEIFSYDQHKFF